MKNKEITDLLISLGFKPDKVGFVYLEEVLEYIYADPSLTLKEAYKKIIQSKEATNRCTIDGSIRNIIRSAFDSGKLMNLNKKMGIEVIEQNDCPTNKLLIFYLIRYIQGLIDNSTFD